MSTDGGSQLQASRSEGAEKSLRRTDLLDEKVALEASKDRRFWRTAKWIVPWALLSAIGLSLGAWDIVLTIVAAIMVGVATWNFIGANARDAQITRELDQLGSPDAEAEDDMV